jgi:hypothetical protein
VYGPRQFIEDIVLHLVAGDAESFGIRGLQRRVESAPEHRLTPGWILRFSIIADYAQTHTEYRHCRRHGQELARKTVMNDEFARRRFRTISQWPGLPFAKIEHSRLLSI